MGVAWFLFLLFFGATLFQMAVWAVYDLRFAIYDWARSDWPAHKRDVPNPDPNKVTKKQNRNASEIRNPTSEIECSVIVCVRNGAEQLRANLPFLLTQRHAASYEVVVVDDASTDQSVQVVEALMEKYPHLRLVRHLEKKRPGKKDALTLGIQAARYDCLLLTDADCRPASDQWLTLMVAPFARQGIQGVLGAAPFFSEKGFARWARFEAAYTLLQYSTFALYGLPYMGVGRNLAWHRSLFEALGGFEAHAHLPSGDDDLLVNAVAHAGNTSICFDPGAFVYSSAKKSLGDWLRQKRRQLAPGTHYRPLHQFLLGTIALTHTLHYGLGAILLAAGILPGWVLLLYGLRLVITLHTYRNLFNRLGERGWLPWLPLFDGLLAVYYGLFVPYALWKRTNQWNG